MSELTGSMRWRPPRANLVTGRTARLTSGLVLFSYVATHLANHALGLVSLRVTEEVARWFVAFWHSVPATASMLGAVLVHIAGAFVALYRRRTLRLPIDELIRIALGFSIPFLLLAHLTTTRIAHELYERTETYAPLVRAMWSAEGGLKQFILMAVAWAHGCLGIHFVLRHRRWYRVSFHLLFAAAVLLPALSFMGFVSLGREVAVLSTDPVWSRASLTPFDVLSRGQLATLAQIQWRFGEVLAVLLCAVIVARLVRSVSERRRRASVAIRYPTRTVHVPRGWSVLEASREHYIAHLSLCGGRARCSTCRVRVIRFEGRLPAPGPDERGTLERIRAPADVRLACQLRPESDIEIALLMRHSRAAPTAPTELFSGEREIVVLFADLRLWTTLSEQHLPYDLVYVLNQYFEAAGDAVRAAGGVPNQFIGDCVMALFGLDTDLPRACRQALAAARGLEHRMRHVNMALERQFGRTLGFGVGIHAGPAVIGHVGYRETHTLSAVGDTVNTASRLQELTKVHRASLVLSEVVAGAAGIDTRLLPHYDVAIRGRDAPLKVFVVDQLQQLEPLGVPVV